MAIPKKIHYIWIGNSPMSKLHRDCMETWQKCCPDYEIIGWNESNYDMTKNPLIVNAVAAKNWALATDYMRVDILNQHGGVYLDTDVELVKSFDDLLCYRFFVGYEDRHWLSNAIVASEPNNPLLYEIMEIYMQDPRVLKYSNLVSVFSFSTVFREYYGISNNGKTVFDGDNFALLSKDYFYAQDWISQKTKLTKNTICIHRGNKSWFNRSQIAGIKVLNLLRRIVGRRTIDFFKGFVVRKIFRICKKRIWLNKGLSVQSTKKKTKKFVGH